MPTPEDLIALQSQIDEACALIALTQVEKAMLQWAYDQCVDGLFGPSSMISAVPNSVEGHIAEIEEIEDPKCRQRAAELLLKKIEEIKFG